MHTLDILDIGHTLLFQKSGEVDEREGMPLDGLWTVILAAMIEDVLINGRTDSAPYSLRGKLAGARR